MAAAFVPCSRSSLCSAPGSRKWTCVSITPGRICRFLQSSTLSAFAPSQEGYALAWTFKAEGRIVAGPVVAGGAVYIVDDKGFVYRLEANDS